MRRRSLLAGCGAAALSLPFVDMLARRGAHAAEGRAPVRFLGLFNPHGSWAEYWRPRAPSGGPAGRVDFTFDFPWSALAPLQPWRDRLIVFDGIDYKAHMVTPHGAEVGHEAGMKSLLTAAGWRADGGRFANSMSVDRFLELHLPQTTPVPSLRLGVGTTGGRTEMSTLCFDEHLSRLENQEHPYEVYRDHFVGRLGTPDPALRRTLSRRESILDAATADLQRLQKTLPASESHKLAAHLDALRTIERGLSKVSCDHPMVVDEAWSLPVPEASRLQIDLVVQAFACDLTRISTLQWMYSGMSMPMSWVSPAAEDPSVTLDLDIHHGVAHRVDETALARKQTALVQRWYASEVAYLLESLDVPDPMGEGTILDNTVILWGNSLGEHAAHHTLMRIPILMLGGGGGMLKTGQYLQLQPPFGRYVTEVTKDMGYAVIDEATRRANHFSNNQLLTGVCRMMGLPEVDYFGDPRLSDDPRFRGVQWQGSDADWCAS